ncbi:kinase-like domain-containing protein [Penicillium nucicola]|uniref:kinase-like domain-containing protein n=1 Tax=Penicillium nucicola TaxID=1850975 RepID=UPI0025453C60|nr:kinase-like domain-containing protein [Penicillium nucicola]KAJ5747743.1 kinase-like domain-containing protein [Penicillium nucicola]
MFLRSGKFLWQSAQSVTPDEAYVNYLNCRLEDDGYSPIQALGNTPTKIESNTFVIQKRCRNVVYAMLHPVAGSRITAAEILRSEWALGVAVCEVGEKGL